MREIKVQPSSMYAIGGYMLIAIFSLCISMSWAQAFTYSGKVVDENGLGLPWAIIRAEGSSALSQSKLDGSFTFSGTAPVLSQSGKYPSSSSKTNPTLPVLGESHQADGRILAVTQAAASRWFKDPDGTHAYPLEKPTQTSAYGLRVSKANFQDGIFPQSEATTTGLVLTLRKSATDTATFAAEKKLCLDTLNACRATLGLPAMAWSKSLEAFADEAARYDAGLDSAHAHFKKFSANANPSDAENALPGWPLKNYKSVGDIVLKGTQMMWDERLDPAGQQGHYVNIKGNQTEVGCGIFITAAGKVWVVQDFK